MARFEEYLEKTEPEDTDISVLYDGDENATKKFHWEILSNGC